MITADDVLAVLMPGVDVPANERAALALGLLNAARQAGLLPNDGQVARLRDDRRCQFVPYASELLGVLEALQKEFNETGQRKRLLEEVLPDFREKPAMRALCDEMRAKYERPSPEAA